MKVRLVDYTRYVNHRLKQYHDLQSKYEDDLETATKKYESKWINKLFKWKFKNSEEYRWTWSDYTYEIKSTKDTINLLAYLSKTDKTEVAITDGNTLRNFCNWCAKNNIPY